MRNNSSENTTHPVELTIRRKIRGMQAIQGFDLRVEGGIRDLLDIRARPLVELGR